MKNLSKYILILGLGSLITACSDPDQATIRDTAEKIAERNRQAAAPSIESPAPEENENNEELEQLRTQVEGLQQQLSQAQTDATNAATDSSVSDEEREAFEEREQAMRDELEKQNQALENLAKLIGQDVNSETPFLSSEQGIATLGLLAFLNDYKNMTSQILQLGNKEDDEESNEASESGDHSVDPRCSSGAVGTTASSSDSLGNYLRQLQTRYEEQQAPQTEPATTEEQGDADGNTTASTDEAPESESSGDEAGTENTEAS